MQEMDKKQGEIEQKGLYEKHIFWKILITCLTGAWYIISVVFQ